MMQGQANIKFTNVTLSSGQNAKPLQSPAKIKLFRSDLSGDLYSETAS